MPSRAGRNYGSDDRTEKVTDKAIDIAEGITVTAIGIGDIDVIRQMNEIIFEESRIINSMDREDLMILVAWEGGEPIGFKVGYRENRFLYYSAKGGVLPEHRGRGIATKMLNEMCTRARAKGYRRLAYDTFPNMHPGMAILGLREQFRIVKADFNPVYKDFRIRFEKNL